MSTDTYSPPLVVASSAERRQELTCPMVCRLKLLCRSSLIVNRAEECQRRSSFGPDGKPLRNKEGSSAIGKYQILASDHEEKAKKWDLTSKPRRATKVTPNTSTQTRVAPNTGKQIRDLSLVGNRSFELTLGEVKLYLLSFWLPSIDMERITTHPNGDTLPLTGLGNKKYRVLWNNEIEEDFPRAEGIPPKNPKTVSCFRLKSRES